MESTKKNNDGCRAQACHQVHHDLVVVSPAASCIALETKCEPGKFLTSVSQVLLRCSQRQDPNERCQNPTRKMSPRHAVHSACNSCTSATADPAATCVRPTCRLVAKSEFLRNSPTGNTSVTEMQFTQHNLSKHRNENFSLSADHFVACHVSMLRGECRKSCRCDRQTGNGRSVEVDRCRAYMLRAIKKIACQSSEICQRVFVRFVSTALAHPCQVPNLLSLPSV